MVTSVLAPLKKALFRFHIWVYRLTGGRLLGHVAGAPVLLLTTTGRKTGRTRTWPLLYRVEGDAYLVVASNSGSANHPSWYLNLRSYPAVTIQLGNRRFCVDAHTATPEERVFLWPKMVELFPGYEKYQQRTQRQIPVVVLDPVCPGGPTGRC